MKAALYRITRFALASSLLLAAGAARAETVTEPSTGHAFETSRTEGGAKYALLGVGVRKKFIIKVYAMGLYVEEAEAKKAFGAAATRAGGADKEHLTAGDHAQRFVIHGGFGRLAVLHFARGVDKEKIAGAYRESLEGALADAELKPAAEAFIAAFDKDVKEGEEIRIATSGDGKISMNVAGSAKEIPANPKLVRAIWEIWLGAKPISKDLRAGLVERIDLLGK